MFLWLKASITDTNTIKHYSVIDNYSFEQLIDLKKITTYNLSELQSSHKPLIIHVIFTCALQQVGNIQEIKLSNTKLYFK